MSWTDLFVTKDPSPPEPSKPATAAAPAASPTVGRLSPLPVSFMQTSVSEDSAAYKRLASSTDKKTLQAFDQIQRLMEPLKGVIEDENLRFKAALAQVAAATGHDRNEFKASFLAALDTLFVKLDDEKRGFENYTEQKIQKDIKGNEAKIAGVNQQQLDREQQIAGLQNQIKDLEALRDQLRSDVVATQQSIDTARREFQAAYDRRKEELERQKQEYKTLLT
jgi:chromosome segregation ATPase